MNDFTVNPTDKIKELEREIAALKATHIETRHGKAIPTSELFRRLEKERDELKAEQSQSINETKARGIEDAIIYANNRVTEEDLEHGDKIEVKILNKYAEKLRSE